MQKTKNFFYEFKGLPQDAPGYVQDPMRPYWAWDLQRMRLEIPRLFQMGVDHVILTGMMKVPRRDQGYNISDHFLIDQEYGDMEYDLFDFVSMCHTHHITVLVDMVLTHVSTEHEWFRKKRHPEFFWLTKENPEKAELKAELKWFDAEGNINLALADEFRHISKYWMNWNKCDGFMLHAPQIRGGEVINAIFGKPLEDVEKEPILILETSDPTGAVMSEYLKTTPIQYVTNALIKDMPEDKMKAFLADCIRNPILKEGLVLDLESYGSMRYLSRDDGCTDKKAKFSRELNMLFWTSINNIKIFQGQELGKEGSTKEVPMIRGESDKQVGDPDSFFNCFTKEARFWKKVL